MIGHRLDTEWKGRCACGEAPNPRVIAESDIVMLKPYLDWWDSWACPACGRLHAVFIGLDNNDAWLLRPMTPEEIMKHYASAESDR